MTFWISQTQHNYKRNLIIKKCYIFLHSHKEGAHYENLRILFRLKNAPATFQCVVMDNVLRAVNNTLAYPDDVMLYATFNSIWFIQKTFVNEYEGRILGSNQIKVNSQEKKLQPQFQKSKKNENNTNGKLNVYEQVENQNLERDLMKIIQNKIVLTVTNAYLSKITTYINKCQMYNKKRI